LVNGLLVGLLKRYFKDEHLKRSVDHQIESFNDFINNQIKATIEMFNPLVIHSEQFYNKEYRKYTLKYYSI
jgi:DNA-directed RNA polymerase beta subunit